MAQEESKEFEKEVDGVIKTFVKIDGVEYEIIPAVLMDEKGEPILDKDGNFQEDKNPINRDIPKPEFTDSSSPVYNISSK